MNSPRRLGVAAVAALTALGPLTLATSQRAASAADATTTLTITARTSFFNNVGSTAEVRVNGDTVATIDVNAADWSTYEVSVPRLKSSDRVDLRFANDRALFSEDRNLFVRDIESEGVRAYANDATTTYDRGNDWAQATDGEDVLAGQQKLWWNGALRFVWPTVAERQSPSPRVTAEPTRGVVTPQPATPSSSPSATVLPSATATPSASPAPTGLPSNEGTPRPSVAPTAAPAPRGLVPFASDSFWYKPIPKDTPLHPNSHDFAANLVRDTTNNVATVNTRAYAPPIYIADANTTRVKVHYENCTGAKNDEAWLEKKWTSQFDSVPLPAAPVPAAGEDAEIVIWSPSTNEVWEMWRFKAGDNGYTACWGGKIAGTHNSDGVFPYPFGVTAGGLSLLGGTIRVDELRSGRINHAMAIGINRPRKGVYSWPANRTDGTWDDVRAIPEGQRLRLDPNLDVESLNISPIAKIIARAAQEYGFIVRDNTNGPLVIYAEDANSYIRAGKENPYTQMFGAEYWYWMEEFPWDKIQGLPHDYGKP